LTKNCIYYANIFRQLLSAKVELQLKISFAIISFL
jgi:hypothetical protein